jgi:hypothetical protein
VTGWIGVWLPVIAALLLARRIAPHGARIAIALPLAGVAMGAASVFAFALLAAGMHSRSLFIAVDAVAWFGVIGIALRMRSATQEAHPPPAEAVRGDRALAAAAVLLVVAAAGVAAVWFVASSAVYPHGEWDAWAQWNLRARFFFRGFADGTWRDAFALVLQWSHPDYPMLVPMSVARMWLYGRADTVLAPVVFGGAMAAATVATAAFSVGHHRGAARACLAAAAILACPSFVRYSAAQCADVALGFLLLGAFVFWARAADAPANRWYWALAGMSAALAGWTKNEGLAACAVFLVTVTGERLWTTRRARGIGSLLAGAAPVLLVIVIFKMTLAPSSYFTAEQTFAHALASLVNGERIRVVADAFARELWLTGATVVGVLPVLALLALIRGIDRRGSIAARAAIPAMLVLLLIYGAAYIVTPKDLVWQLQTSLDRLVLQVVPTLTWAVIMLCR